MEQVERRTMSNFSLELFVRERDSGAHRAKMSVSVFIRRQYGLEKSLELATRIANCYLRGSRHRDETCVESSMKELCVVFHMWTIQILKNKLIGPASNGFHSIYYR